MLICCHALSQGETKLGLSVEPENKNEQPPPNQIVEKMLCDFIRPWITSHLFGRYKY